MGRAVYVSSRSFQNALSKRWLFLLDCVLFFLRIELKVSPDVAGATFMAAGSSAPELATVVIGVFLAKDDIGVSGVIGSAVFNIMFVIAVCGLASTTVTYLNWWPLCRDSFFYTISILIMLLAIYNETISWYPPYPYYTYFKKKLKNIIVRIYIYSIRVRTVV